MLDSKSSTNKLLFDDSKRTNNTNNTKLKTYTTTLPKPS